MEWGEYQHGDAEKMFRNQFMPSTLSYPPSFYQEEYKPTGGDFWSETGRSQGSEDESAEGQGQQRGSGTIDTSPTNMQVNHLAVTGSPLHDLSFQDRFTGIDGMQAREAQPQGAVRHAHNNPEGASMSQGYYSGASSHEHEDPQAALLAMLTPNQLMQSTESPAQGQAQITINTTHDSTSSHSMPTTADRLPEVSSMMEHASVTPAKHISQDTWYLFSQPITRQYQREAPPHSRSPAMAPPRSDNNIAAFTQPLPSLARDSAMSDLHEADITDTDDDKSGSETDEDDTPVLGSVNEALDDTVDRIPMTIKAGEDDWQEVESNSVLYIERMMKALEHTTLQAPPGIPSTKPGQPSKPSSTTLDKFRNWQNRAQKDVEQILKATNKRDVERNFWRFFKALLDVHKLGPRQIGQWKCDTTTKCSARIEVAVKVEDFSLARKNVLTRDRLDKFAANPAGFRKSKLASRSTNELRQKNVDAKRSELKAMAGPEQVAPVQPPVTGELAHLPTAAQAPAQSLSSSLIGYRTSTAPDFLNSNQTSLDPTSRPGPKRARDEDDSSVSSVRPPRRAGGDNPHHYHNAVGTRDHCT